MGSFFSSSSTPSRSPAPRSTTPAAPAQHRPTTPAGRTLPVARPPPPMPTRPPPLPPKTLVVNQEAAASSAGISRSASVEPSGSRQQAPPSYACHGLTPLVAVPPSDQKHWFFRNLLMTLSGTPLRYENPGLLDEALALIPLDRIYGEAEDESQMFEAQAQSLGKDKAEWGYQDCIIRALLRSVLELRGVGWPRGLGVLSLER